MCDGMFTSHVNAIINICADLKENCVCTHVNLLYIKLTIKRRLFKENKMSELKKVTRKKDKFFSVSERKFIENICE